ncbi:MAG: heme biosynthesis protein HemY [Alphaproteobacteria bacterium]|nr:heme biosynthesis protein HemY [Alphaproteobacteria bacterium]
MIKSILFLLLLAAAAMGLGWLADRPGEISLVWQGYKLETTVLVGLAAVLATCILFLCVWSVLRFVLRLPSLMSLWNKARKRQRGQESLSRGLIAIGAGDLRAAERATREAERALSEEPLTLLLRAQLAQLTQDREGAERAFQAMLQNPQSRLLGLRGLYVEAKRRNDQISATGFAQQAREHAAVGWAGQAVLEACALQENWARALDIVDDNVKKHLTDRETGRRQKAVLQTALALQLADRETDEALSLAKSANKTAPELVPACVLYGRLLSQRGDVKRAMRILEAGWRLAPHPDIGRAYVDVRPGDSSHDRLKRAQSLAQYSPAHAESCLLIARGALEAREFDKARAAMAPLIEDRAHNRPSVRACLTMADIEETEFGPNGAMREWLARATRAPRDALWIADGILSESWAPASPVTGKIDAFIWQRPAEHLHQALDVPLSAAPKEAEPLVTLTHMKTVEPETKPEVSQTKDSAPEKTKRDEAFTPPTPDDPGPRATDPR